MIAIENNVGRFCEIRTVEPVAMTDMTAFRARLATIFQGIPSRVVIVSDLTQCASIPTEVIQALVTIARIDNPKIERHAFLLHAGDPVATQMQLVATEGGSPGRRVFFDTLPARTWLREVLTIEEADRLDHVLSRMRLRH